MRGEKRTLDPRRPNFTRAKRNLREPENPFSDRPKYTMKLNSQKFQFREKHFHFIYTGPKIKWLYHFISLFDCFVHLPPICGVEFLPVPPHSIISLQSRTPVLLHLHLFWTVVHLHIPIRLWHFLFSHNLLHFPLKQHLFQREINANRVLRSNRYLQYSEN